MTKFSVFLIPFQKHARALNRLRTVLGAVILAIALGFFLYYVRQSLHGARQAWMPVNWPYLALSIALLIICFFIMASLWYGLVRALGGRLAWRTALRFYGITLLPRYVPGLVWGYASRAILCEQEGVSRRVSAGSIIIEVGFLAGSAVVVALFKYLGVSWLAMMGMPGAMLLIGLLPLYVTQRKRLIALFRKLSIWYGLALAYMGFWLLYGMSSWLVVLSVAPGLDASYELAVIVSAIFAWLVGFLAVVVPSGLGVREAVFAVTLAPIIGPMGSLFVPIMARLVAFVAEAAFSLFCVIIHGAKYKNYITRFDHPKI